MNIWIMFLSSIANLLYVLAGFSLGKWESDKSLIALWGGIKELKIWTMHLETVRASTYHWMRQLAGERGEELPPLPFIEMEQPIEMETGWLDEALKKAEKSVKRSLAIGILCLSAGSILFSLSIVLPNLTLSLV